MKSSIKLVLITLLGVIAIVFMSMFIVQGSSNHAIALEEQINTAKSDIEVQEKRRVDLLGNLVDTVKAYDKHEYDTLKAVVDGRSSKDVNVSEVTTMISAVSEQYPQLKADTNYKQLMTELSTTENLIAQHRSNFNKSVKEYNRYVKKFPTRQFLSMTGYEVLDAKYLEYNAPSDAPKDLFKEK